MRQRISLLAAALATAATQLICAQEEVAPGVLLVGQIQNPEIVESSGVAPARRTRGAFWTHNDSGPDIIYAVGQDGQSLAQWKIKDTEIQNAEDIVANGGRLYIADIGNNDGSREQVAVYAVPEPPTRADGEISPVRIWRLEYPGEPFDAESFFVFKGSGYIISKELSKGEVRLYRFPLNRTKPTTTLEKLGKLNVSDEARGASISSDGKRLAVITGSGAYLFTMPKKIALGEDDILEPTLVVPFADNTMEGCAITPEGLLVTSEGRNIYLFTDPLFRTKVAGGKKGQRR